MTNVLDPEAERAADRATAELHAPTTTTLGRSDSRRLARARLARTLRLPGGRQLPGGVRLPRLRPMQAVGLGMLVAVAAVVLLVPLLPSYAPYAQDLANARLAPLVDAAHPLGTDALGRDTLSRLALGGRITVSIALLVVGINVVIGTTLGMIAGYIGGVVDNLISILSDIQLAMPVVLLLIALSAVVGPSAPLMVAVLGLTFWVGYARVARAIALTLRERDFVLAPRIQGGSAAWIIRMHILPHLVPQMLILAVTDIGVIMLMQTSLDYLGLGVQQPVPSWGALIFEGQKLLRSDPWLAILPGAAMFLVVAGTQFLSQRFTKEGGTA